MGVKGLPKELPGGNVNACTRVGFLNLETLRSRLVDIDTGTLVFVCALRHTEAFNTGLAWPLERAAIRVAATWRRRRTTSSTQTTVDPWIQ